MSIFYDMCHANRNHLKSKMVKHGMRGQDVHSRHRAAIMVSEERNTKRFFFLSTGVTSIKEELHFRIDS